MSITLFVYGCSQFNPRGGSSLSNTVSQKRFSQQFFGNETFHQSIRSSRPRRSDGVPGSCRCHRTHRVHGWDVWIGLLSGPGPTGWPGCGGRPCREFVLFPPEGGLALELRCRLFGCFVQWRQSGCFLTRGKKRQLIGFPSRAPSHTDRRRHESTPRPTERGAATRTPGTSTAYCKIAKQSFRKLRIPKLYTYPFAFSQTNRRHIFATLFHPMLH